MIAWAASVLILVTGQAFPPPGKLPKQTGLPDPFRKADGTRVKSRDEWPEQRRYLKAMLAYYQYGRMPPKPDDAHVEWGKPERVFDGEGELLPFTIRLDRKGKSLTVRAAALKPAGDGPFPSIIKNDRVLFDAITDSKGSEKTILRRGYALWKFVRTDLARDEAGKRNEGVFPLYPEYDWGTIAAWAWGYSLVIDALETRRWADRLKIAVTGHSRGGKTALCGGIYDERIGLTAPNSSGTGGTGSALLFEKGKRPQTLTVHKERDRHAHWWNPRWLEFAGREDRMPFDAHTNKILIAPRGLVNPHGLQDYWANPYGTELTHRAALRVFEWLGVAHRIGIHWRPGGHAQGPEDWAALLDFADAFFAGKKTAKRRFDKLAYPDAKVPASWSAP